MIIQINSCRECPCKCSCNWPIEEDTYEGEWYCGAWIPGKTGDPDKSPTVGDVLIPDMNSIPDWCPVKVKIPETELQGTGEILKKIPTIDLIKEIENREKESIWSQSGIISIDINPGVFLHIYKNHQSAGSYPSREPRKVMILSLETITDQDTDRDNRIKSEKGMSHGTF